MLRRALLALACALVLLPVAPAAADTCLGSACPYASERTFGDSGNGVLRFPQAVAIGPDGSVYVGDQHSHLVQVFAPDGTFQRQFGTPGIQPGQLTAVSSITVAPTGTVVLTDGGTDTLDFFDQTGALIGKISGRGTGAGQFFFGRGGGNDSPAGGGVAYGSGYIFVSDSMQNRVQRMLLDGSQQTILIPPGQLANPRGLAVSGNSLIVADDKNHRLAVFGLDGTFRTAVGRGQGAGPGQLNFPFGVAADRWGRIFVADDMNQRVVRFGPGPKYPYRARWGSYGSGPGQLAYPRAIAADALGQIYVANTGNDRIDVFTNSGALVRSFGRSGRGTGEFNTPLGVGVDGAGNRGVVDGMNGRVELIAPDGQIASVWGSPNPGPTVLLRPVDMAFDAAGNGYVLDTARSRVVVFDRSTARPSLQFGQVGSGPGQMVAPQAIAIAPDGTVWITDSGNNRIVHFSAAGSYIGQFATGDQPRGIALSPDGARIYVTTNHSRVLIFDPAGSSLGRFGYGPGRKLGQLSAPAGITVDGAGTVWIADRGNNRIAYFGPDGQRLGAFGERGSGDLAQFSYPTGVAVDCNGKLTVTDTRNNVVRELTLASPVPTVTCTPLPAPAPPPPLKPNTLPPPEGPVVSARVLRRTGLVDRGIALRAGCDTTCLLKVTGTITQRGRPPKPRNAKHRPSPVSVPLRPTTVAIPGGATKIVRLALTARDRLALRRALARYRGVTVALALTATAPAGSPTTTPVDISGTR